MKYYQDILLSRSKLGINWFIVIGVCECEDNTEGTNCEKCAVGYYGVPFKDLSSGACQPCPCNIVSDAQTGLPRYGMCTQSTTSGKIQCLECSEGHTG